VFLAFGVVEDEGFVFVFSVLWWRGSFFKDIVLLIGSLMGERYAWDIVSLSDIVGRVQNWREFIFFLLFLFVFGAFSLLLGVDIGQENGKCIGFSTFAAAAWLVLSWAWLIFIWGGVHCSETGFAGIVFGLLSFEVFWCVFSLFVVLVDVVHLIFSDSSCFIGE